MSTRLSRRAPLGSASTALLSGLAGCGFGQLGNADSSQSGNSTTYGLVVFNAIDSVEFNHVSDLSDPVPAVIHLRVNDLDPASDEIYVEETVEVVTGGKKTIQDAFTTESGGPTYAVNAEFEPFVEGGLSRDDNRQDGIAFAHGSDTAPSANPTPVVVQNGPPEDSMDPYLRVQKMLLE